MAVFWAAFASYLIKAVSGNAGSNSAFINIIFFMIIGAVVGSQQEFLRDSSRHDSQKAIENFETP
jgi:hypothetical protein